ncbi:MAG: hypothetical protein GX606_00620, partial [Elusimicrobia bacterium]|nr:hypothetical protein [Elusimicrobiota bacterium]
MAILFGTGAAEAQTVPPAVLPQPTLQTVQVGKYDARVFTFGSNYTFKVGTQADPRAVAVINGGYFDGDRKPVALVKVNGTTVRRYNKANDDANGRAFNGQAGAILYSGTSMSGIVPASSAVASAVDGNPAVTDAIQAGPLVLNQGNFAITPDKHKKNSGARNFIARHKNGTWSLVYTQGSLFGRNGTPLAEMARFFQAQGYEDVMTVDGGRRGFFVVRDAQGREIERSTRLGSPVTVISVVPTFDTPINSPVSLKVHGVLKVLGGFAAVGTGLLGLLILLKKMASFRSSRGTRPSRFGGRMVLMSLIAGAGLLLGAGASVAEAAVPNVAPAPIVLVNPAAPRMAAPALRVEAQTRTLEASGYHVLAVPQAYQMKGGWKGMAIGLEKTDGHFAVITPRKAETLDVAGLRGMFGDDGEAVVEAMRRAAGRPVLFADKDSEGDEAMFRDLFGQTKTALDLKSPAALVHATGSDAFVPLVLGAGPDPVAPEGQEGETEEEVSSSRGPVAEREAALVKAREAREELQDKIRDAREQEADLRARTALADQGQMAADVRRDVMGWIDGEAKAAVTDPDAVREAYRDMEESSRLKDPKRTSLFFGVGLQGAMPLNMWSFGGGTIMGGVGLSVPEQPLMNLAPIAYNLYSAEKAMNWYYYPFLVNEGIKAIDSWRANRAGDDYYGAYMAPNRGWWTVLVEVDDVTTSARLDKGEESGRDRLALRGITVIDLTFDALNELLEKIPLLKALSSEERIAFWQKNPTYVLGELEKLFAARAWSEKDQNIDYFIRRGADHEMLPGTKVPAQQYAFAYRVDRARAIATQGREGVHEIFRAVRFHASVSSDGKLTVDPRLQESLKSGRHPLWMEKGAFYRMPNRYRLAENAVTVNAILDGEINGIKVSGGSFSPVDGSLVNRFIQGRQMPLLGYQTIRVFENNAWVLRDVLVDMTQPVRVNGQVMYWPSIDGKEKPQPMYPIAVLSQEEVVRGIFFNQRMTPRQAGVTADFFLSRRATVEDPRNIYDLHSVRPVTKALAETAVVPTNTAFRADGTPSDVQAIDVLRNGQAMVALPAGMKLPGTYQNGTISIFIPRPAGVPVARAITPQGAAWFMNDGELLERMTATLGKRLSVEVTLKNGPNPLALGQTLKKGDVILSGLGLNEEERQVAVIEYGANAGQTMRTLGDPTVSYIVLDKSGRPTVYRTTDDVRPDFEETALSVKASASVPASSRDLRAVFSRIDGQGREVAGLRRDLRELRIAAEQARKDYEIARDLRGAVATEGDVRAEAGLGAGLTRQTTKMLEDLGAQTTDLQQGTAVSLPGLIEKGYVFDEYHPEGVPQDAARFAYDAKARREALDRIRAMSRENSVLREMAEGQTEALRAGDALLTFHRQAKKAEAEIQTLNTRILEKAREYNREAARYNQMVRGTYEKVQGALSDDLDMLPQERDGMAAGLADGFARRSLLRPVVIIDDQVIEMKNIAAPAEGIFSWAEMSGDSASQVYGWGNLVDDEHVVGGVTTGAEAPVYDGGPQGRFVLVDIKTIGGDAEQAYLNKAVAGVMRSYQFVQTDPLGDEDAGYDENRQYYLLADEVGYQNGKLYVGGRAFVAVEDGGDDTVIHGLNGMARYDILPTDSVILEIGAARSRSERDVRVHVYEEDEWGGVSEGHVDTTLRTRESVRFARLSLEHRFSEKTAVYGGVKTSDIGEDLFLGGRVDLDGTFEKFLKMPVRANMEYGFLQRDARAVIKAGRFNLFGTYRNTRSNRYGLTYDILRGERFQVAVGYGMGERYGRKFHGPIVSGTTKVGGVDLNAGISASGDPSAVATWDALDFLRGRKARKDLVLPQGRPTALSTVPNAGWVIPYLTGEDHPTVRDIRLVGDPEAIEKAYHATRPADSEGRLVLTSPAQIERERDIMNSYARLIIEGRLNRGVWSAEAFRGVVGALRVDLATKKMTIPTGTYDLGRGESVDVEGEAVVEFMDKGLAWQEKKLEAELSALRAGGQEVRYQMPDKTLHPVIVAKGDADSDQAAVGVWDESDLVALEAQNRVRSTHLRKNPYGYYHDKNDNKQMDADEQRVYWVEGESYKKIVDPTVKDEDGRPVPVPLRPVMETVIFHKPIDTLILNAADGNFRTIEAFRNENFFVEWRDGSSQYMSHQTASQKDVARTLREQAAQIIQLDAKGNAIGYFGATKVPGVMLHGWSNGPVGTQSLYDLKTRQNIEWQVATRTGQGREFDVEMRDALSGEVYSDRRIQVAVVDGTLRVGAQIPDENEIEKHSVTFLGERFLGKSQTLGPLGGHGIRRHMVSEGFDASRPLLSTSGRTEIQNGGRELFTTSRMAMDDMSSYDAYWQARMTNAVNTVALADAVRLKVHLENPVLGKSHTETKDFYGRVLFDATRFSTTQHKYQGISEIVGVAHETRMTDRRGRVIDVSYLLNRQGRRITDFNDINLATNIFDRGTLSYEGARIYRSVDRQGKVRELRDQYVAIRDVPGRMLIETIGHYDAEGRFVPEERVYSIYLFGVGQYGRYDIATKTVRTRVLANGSEEIIAFANNTHFKDGYLIYKTQRGFGAIAQGLELTGDPIANQKALQEFFTQGRTITFRHRLEGVVEIKDNEGRLVAILSGHKNVDRAGYPAGRPLWATVLDYNSAFDYRVSSGSDEFMYSASLGDHPENNPAAIFAARPVTGAYEIITHLSRPEFIREVVNGADYVGVKYDVESKKFPGLRQQTFLVDGQLLRSRFADSGQNGPKDLMLTFDRNSLPETDRDLSRKEGTAYSVFRKTFYRDYALLERFISPDLDENGSLREGQKPASLALVKDGVVRFERGGWGRQLVPFVSVKSADDHLGRSIFGRTLRAALGYRTEAERVMDGMLKNRKISGLSSEIDSSLDLLKMSGGAFDWRNIAGTLAILAVLGIGRLRRLIGKTVGFVVMGSVAAVRKVGNKYSGSSLKKAIDGIRVKVRSVLHARPLMIAALVWRDLKTALKDLFILAFAVPTYLLKEFFWEAWYLLMAHENFNMVTIEQILGWGFTKDEAIELLGMRNRDGAFVDGDDVHDRMVRQTADGENFHVLDRTIAGLTWAQRQKERLRQHGAMTRLVRSLGIQRGEIPVKESDIRNAQDLTTLLNLFGYEDNDKGVTQSVAAFVRGVVVRHPHVTLNGLKEILLSLNTVRRGLSADVFRGRFIARVIRLAHYNPDTTFRSDVRDLVQADVIRILRNFGFAVAPLEEGEADQGLRFKGEYAGLLQGIMESIEHAAFWEELLLPVEMSVSGIYLATNDALEKDAPLEARIRTRLVSLDQFVLMQVIQQVQVALNGNGRFEEWEAREFNTAEDTRNWRTDPAHARKAVEKMRHFYKVVANFKGILHAHMGAPGGPSKGKQEKVKDRYGDTYRDHEWSLLWEEWNEMFRYILKQDNNQADGQLKIEDPAARPFESLRSGLEDYLREILNGKACGSDAEKAEFYRRARAFLMFTKRSLGHARSSVRLGHHDMYWMGLWRLLFSHRLRRGNFGSAADVKMHFDEFKRKVNTAIVFIGVGGLGYVIIGNALSQIPFIGIPFFVSIANPWVLGGIAIAYLALMIVGTALRNGSIKKADIKKTVRRHKTQLILQSLTLLAGIALMTLLPPTHMFLIPAWVRTLNFWILWALVFETLKFTFYAVHFVWKGVLTILHYLRQHIYDVVVSSQLPAALDRIFSSRVPGYYDRPGRRLTMGEERADEFVASVFEDLSNPDDAQNLIVSDGDIDRWHAVLEDYRRAARGEPTVLSRLGRMLVLRQLLDAGDARWSAERIHRIIRWANDQLRKDRPTPPRVDRDLLSYAISMQGYSEAVYYDEKDLNDPSKNPAEISTRLGQLAADKTEMWLGLVARLETGIMVAGETWSLSPAEKIAMLSLIKEQHKELRFDTPERHKAFMSYIIPWATTQLASLWNNSNSALKIKRRYAYTLARIHPEYSAAELALAVEAFTRNVMVKHTQSSMYMEYAFPAMADEDKFIAQVPGNAQIVTLREYLYYYLPLVRAALHRGEITPEQLEKYADNFGRKMVVKLEELKAIASRYDPKDPATKPVLKEFYDAVAAKRLEDFGLIKREKTDPKDPDYVEFLVSGNPVALLNKATYGTNVKGIVPMVRAMIVDGLNATWNRADLYHVFNEQTHNFKWNSLTASLPYTGAIAVDLIDADHHARTEDIWSAPEVFSEFVYNTRLGSGVSVSEFYLAKGIGVVGNIVPTGENAFTFHSQEGKMQMGGVSAYGRFVVRMQAMRWSEGLAGDDYVAEDSLTALLFATFGYQPTRFAYFRRGKNWMYQAADHKTPAYKWASDMPESVLGVVSEKVLATNKVDWAYKIDNFWWDGFGFYNKEPQLPRYGKWLTVFFLILGNNLFAGLSALMWVGGSLMSQAISYGNVFQFALDEHLGWIRGTLKFLKELSTRLYWYFVPLIYMYEEAVGIMGSQKLAAFIASAGKGATKMRDLDKRDLYLRYDYIHRQGAWWTAIILIAAGFNPTLFGYWILPLLMPVSAWMGMFMLNPVRNAKDRVTNITDSLWAGYVGILDQINFLNVRMMMGFNIFGRRTSYEEITLFAWALQHLGITPIHKIDVEKAGLNWETVVSRMGHNGWLVSAELPAERVLFKADLGKLTTFDLVFGKDAKVLAGVIKKGSLLSSATNNVAGVYKFPVFAQYVSHYRRLLGTVSIVAEEAIVSSIREALTSAGKSEEEILAAEKAMTEALQKRVRNEPLHPEALAPEGHLKTFLGRVKDVKAQVALLVQDGALSSAQAESIGNRAEGIEDRLTKALADKNVRAQISYDEFEAMSWFLAQAEYLPNTIKTRPGWLTRTLHRVAWYVIGMDLVVSLIDTLIYEFSYRRMDFFHSLGGEIADYSHDLGALLSKTLSRNPLHWILYPVRGLWSLAYNLSNFFVLGVVSPTFSIVYLTIDRFIPDLLWGIGRKIASLKSILRKNVPSPSAGAEAPSTPSQTASEPSRPAPPSRVRKALGIALVTALLVPGIWFATTRFPQKTSVPARAPVASQVVATNVTVTPAAAAPVISTNTSVTLATTNTIRAPVQPAAPVVRPATTLTVSGRPVRGVTIDAQTFDKTDVSALSDLGADTVRTYYPIPPALAQRMAEEAGIRMFIVGIPLNQEAYGEENLTRFWGLPVPDVNTRISLTQNNYLDYLKDLRSALNGEAEVVADLLNEPNFDNNYPRWVKKSVGPAMDELFALIDAHARKIHAAIPGMKVATTLGYRPEHFARALRTDVDIVGVNYYCHNEVLADDMVNAFRQAGIRKPFYLAEAGASSLHGEEAQAALTLQDWEAARRMGLGVTFMSLEDNAAKTRAEGTEGAHWGWRHQSGQPKKVWKIMKKAWSETPSVSITPQEAQGTREPSPAPVPAIPVQGSIPVLGGLILLSGRRKDRRKEVNRPARPSARVRPGQDRPTEEQVQAALVQMQRQGLVFARASGALVARTAVELRRQDEGAAAALLERLFAANRVPAPPVEDLSDGVHNVFLDVFGLNVFEDGVLDEEHLALYVSGDISDETHPEFLPTLLHEAVEAASRISGESLTVAHLKARIAEERFRESSINKGGYLENVRTEIAGRGDVTLRAVAYRADPGARRRVVLHSNRSGSWADETVPMRWVKNENG